jgi:hypothetical protein
MDIFTLILFVFIGAIVFVLGYTVGARSPVYLAEHRIREWLEEFELRQCTYDEMTFPVDELRIVTLFDQFAFEEGADEKKDHEAVQDSSP